VEKIMKITELFLDELEREAEGSRHALQRVPEGKNDWKPHEKSMALGSLARLVAYMPSWIAMTINQDELDLNPDGKQPPKPPEWHSRRELLDFLDKSVAEAREALKKTSDEHLMTTWKLLVGGRVVSEDPRYVVIRDSVFNHAAHHRGQLTVYLRLCNASVPAIYGPSADEGKF
jgi:uncharacterized damage-inducible protein DinB